MLGLFLQKVKKELHLLVIFKYFLKNMNANQTKYGLIKAVNFTTDQ